MKVRDVLLMPEYREKVQEVLDGEQASYDKLRDRARREGARVGRSPIDHLKDKGAWDADKMIDLFACVLNKTLVGFGASDRMYIYLIGMEAFKRIMSKLKEDVLIDAT